MLSHFQSPNLEPILIHKFTAYLARHGWSQVDHPNSRIILFQGLLDDENHPLQLILPAKITFRDARIRIEEAINLVSIVQQESHASILNQIMATDIEESPKVVKAFGFLKWLSPIFRINFANAAFASSHEPNSIASRKLIAEGLLDEGFPDLPFKVFSSSDGYEIVIQTSNADYNGRIVALGSDKETISLLGVITDRHEVYDDYVSNLLFRGNYSTSMIGPIALVDEKALSNLYEEGRVSEHAIENSANSTATSSGKKAWKRIAESADTVESLRKRILSMLEKL